MCYKDIHMKTIMTLIALLMTFSFVHVYAQNNSETSSANSRDQVEAIEKQKVKAKKRLYPGGRDEEPLQVQSQLTNPSRGQSLPQEDLEPSDHD